MSFYAKHLCIDFFTIVYWTVTGLYFYNMKLMVIYVK